MQESEKLVGQLSDFVWGQPLLILLLDTHILPHVPPLLHAAVHRQGNQTFGLKRARNISRATGLMAEGPMYVLERGMKQKWLGVIFAILTAISAFGSGTWSRQIPFRRW
jgi:Na+/alanine symporter